MLRLLRKAETGQNAGHARRRAMGIDGVQPVVDLADAMWVFGVLGLGEKLRALGRRRQHRLERRGIAARRFLRHIADARPGRSIDAALIGLVKSGDHFEQRRFPGAVPADQADMGFGRQRR